MKNSGPKTRVPVFLYLKIYHTRKNFYIKRNFCIKNMLVIHRKRARVEDHIYSVCIQEYIYSIYIGIYTQYMNRNIYIGIYIGTYIQYNSTSIKLNNPNIPFLSYIGLYTQYIYRIIYIVNIWECIYSITVPAQS